MKKRAISLFLTVSISFTLFYPELSLNDNVLEVVKKEEFRGESTGVWLEEYDEISLARLLRAPRGEKEFKLKFLDWFSEICK